MARGGTPRGVEASVEDVRGAAERRQPGFGRCLVQQVDRDVPIAPTLGRDAARTAGDRPALLGDKALDDAAPVPAGRD
jgi:hypothetical protein